MACHGVVIYNVVDVGKGFNLRGDSKRGYPVFTKGWIVNTIR